MTSGLKRDRDYSGKTGRDGKARKYMERVTKEKRKNYGY